MDIVHLPSFLVGFTNLSANTIRGIEHATDNTKNGTLYYEPSLCNLFEHVIEDGATLNSELVTKFKNRKQIVSKKKLNQATHDRIYVEKSSIDESTVLKTERYLRVIMNEYYKGGNPRFDPDISDVAGATVDLGYDLPIHSGAQAKSSHSTTDPKIKSTDLKKLNRISGGDKRKMVSTTTILKRTPEIDSFVLLINSWTNITTVENVYDGNFWSDYLSGLSLESVKKLQKSSALLFPNEYKKSSALCQPRKRQVIVEFDDEEYAVYDSLSAASKKSFRDGKLHLRKLKKIKQLEASTIKPERFFLNNL